MEDEIDLKSCPLFALYRKHNKKFVLGYAAIYFLPALVWLKISTDHLDDVIVAVGVKRLLIYTAAMLFCFALHSLFLRKRFVRKLRRLTPGEYYRITESLPDAQRYKLVYGYMFLTDCCIFFTSGVIIPWDSIEEISIRKSEAECGYVYELIIKLYGGRKKNFSAGGKTLPDSFEADINSKNKNIKVTRYNRSFRIGGKK